MPLRSDRVLLIDIDGDLAAIDLNGRPQQPRCDRASSEYLRSPQGLIVRVGRANGACRIEVFGPCGRNVQPKLVEEILVVDHHSRARVSGDSVDRVTARDGAPRPRREVCSEFLCAEKARGQRATRSP